MHTITPLTPYAYKMCAKLQKEGLQCLSPPMPCWHINEETRPFVSVNTQKPSQLKEETCSLRTNYDKDHPSPKPQLSSQPFEEKQPMKPNQFKWGR